VEADILEILDVLETLGGKGFPEILGDPDELRSTIIALEATVNLLKENEQQLYPQQAPRSGRTRRNDVGGDISAPIWQRSKILRVFQRVRQPLTAAQLHGQYIKNVDTFLLELHCDELVESGDLVPLNSKRGDSKRYGLPSDVAMQLEVVARQTNTLKPVTRLRLGDRQVGVYFAIWRTSRDHQTETYTVNFSQYFTYFHIPDGHIPEEDRNLIFYKGSKEYGTIFDWLEKDGYVNYCVGDYLDEEP
jgi:hypothetical protein